MGSGRRVLESCRWWPECWGIKRGSPPRRSARTRCSVVDFRFVSANAELYQETIRNRKVDADVHQVVGLYEEFKKLRAEESQLRSARNENAGQMKKMKAMTAEEREQCILEGKELKARIAELELELQRVETSLNEEAAKLPNLIHPDAPIGPEENAAVLQMVGSKPEFDFEVKSHLELGEALDLFDFENAARVAGNKFYYLRNEAALLELALISWALSKTTALGFTPLITPDLARESVVSGCGYNPRGSSSQIYSVSDSDLCLVGTAEIPLGGYYADQILDPKDLPIKMAAFSHCFRQEVGAAGAVTRGLYRVHQFSKVEMFVISHPDQSDQIHQELRKIEEDMYESLGLHFKVLDMPTEDLGNPAYRKFDIEAWMPGRGSYGEISSASNCTDFQARRLNIRFRASQGENQFVHTLNATACAVPRMIVAILENFQQSDGSVVIPEVLRPYMGGRTKIDALPA
uniref:serine--tRNA ligase n=1 Tax=Compsopogon caeruleus TaxID=31354 RepID=A0A7S1XGN9_9RHOD